MSLLRSTTFSLACILSFSTLALAAGQSSQTAPQATDSSSSSAAQTGNLAEQGLSVQARLRARREQRRQAAIHAEYDHLYEAYLGMGFLRTVAGPGVKGDYGGGLQKVNFYAWNVGFTRNYSERWAVTLDGRGYYGTQFLGPNPTNVVKPAISEYAVLAGPSYRFWMHPRYSVSGRVMVGAVFNNYFADANGFTAPLLGLYPDSGAAVLNISMPIDYNLTNSIVLRCSPEYFMSTFDSSIQNGMGFGGSMVYRWGKL